MCLTATTIVHDCAHRKDQSVMRCRNSTLSGLGHETQPEYRLGSEIQCDARPDYGKDDEDDAVL